MEPAKITLMHHTANKPDGSYIEDPRIVKVAKLVMILASDNVDIEEKRLCLKAAERFNIVTEEEARQLMLYRTALEAFGNDY